MIMNELVSGGPEEILFLPIICNKVSSMMCIS